MFLRDIFFKNLCLADRVGNKKQEKRDEDACQDYFCKRMIKKVRGIQLNKKIVSAQLPIKIIKKKKMKLDE